MRYRSNGVETVHLVARFEPGATVSITIYDLATLLSVSLSNSTCDAIGSTGLFVWPSTRLTAQPTTYTQYAGVMQDTNGTIRSQKFVLGGAMDNLDVASSTRAVESTVAKEATLAAQAALILADTALVLSTGGTGPWTTATGFSVAGDAMTLTTGERDAVADAVWDEARAGHATLGTFGEQLQTAPATAADVTAAETAIRGPDSRTLSELAGAGFTEATDSLEAVRDQGDAAWTTATGFSTHSAGDVDTALSASHGAGSWEEPTAQEMRDAMKLAPSVGAPAADSVDDRLDTILADTAAIEPLATANLDAKVSDVPATVDTTLTASHGLGSWQTATGFTTPADVTTLRDHTEGRRRLDTTPDPWQEVVYTQANPNAEAKRYDLFDQNGDAINATNNPILDPTIIIADRVPV